MVDEDGKAGVRKSLPIGFLAAGFVALALAALALWWYAGAGEEPAAAAVRIDSGDAELVALGGAVYAAHCAACHGAGREGEPDWRERKKDGTLPAPPHDETGHTWHHPDGMLFTITRSGGQAVAPAGYVSAMPGFAGILTDREISASIAFIESHWPLEIRRRQEQITRRSQ
ncbi:MAG: c-type cytochrome [Alphaproteobacteria bacterium]|nr:c-type cytochrome [Alphaproteobacteria bacterium]